MCNICEVGTIGLAWSKVQGRTLTCDTLWSQLLHASVSCVSPLSLPPHQGAFFERAEMKSLRKAIDAKCKDCIHDPLSGLGAWREQVAKCAISSCPLWEVRPRSYSKRLELGMGREGVVKQVSEAI